MSEVLLRVENLRVQFGRFLAVDGVSLELRGGELLGMIGPNGAGKTTTLRAAVGLQPITSGRIEVLGHDVFEHATFVGQHLGFTPDTPQLYETLTVEDFLQFVGRAYGLSRRNADELIDHWLHQLWLSEKKRERVGSLSRGMRQRLAVARTLLPNPNVVLMDEPAAGLDPAGRVQFRRLLANLRDQGKALIVSSHILADLAEYCTHIAIMGHGRFLRYGTVSAVAGDGSQERQRYLAVLAYRVGDLSHRLDGLRQLDGLEVVEEDADRVTVSFDPERERAALLLSRMVEAGLPVAEFRPLAPDLEQAYLKTGIRQVD